MKSHSMQLHEVSWYSNSSLLNAHTLKYFPKEGGNNGMDMQCLFPPINDDFIDTDTAVVLFLTQEKC